MGRLTLLACVCACSCGCVCLRMYMYVCMHSPRPPALLNAAQRRSSTPLITSPVHGMKQAIGKKQTCQQLTPLAKQLAPPSVNQEKRTCQQHTPLATVAGESASDFVAGKGNLLCIHTRACATTNMTPINENSCHCPTPSMHACVKHKSNSSRHCPYLSRMGTCARRRPSSTGRAPAVIRKLNMSSHNTGYGSLAVTLPRPDTPEVDLVGPRRIPARPSIPAG